MQLNSLITYMAIGGLLAGAASSPTFAAANKAATTAVVPYHSDGQGTAPDTSGKFGVTYPLRTDFNFTLQSARYTLDPFIAANMLTAGTNEKVLVLNIDIKNAAKSGNWFSNEGFISVEDEKGAIYPVNSLALQSIGAIQDNFWLTQGQGIGQIALKDLLQDSCVVPDKARIVAVIVNRGRTGKIEDSVRYPIAGATKEEAGAAGDPENVIVPLPGNAHDPADTSGAVALPVGIGTKGLYVPSGHFAIRLDGFDYSSGLLKGAAAPEGKRYAIATVSVKLLTPTDQTMAIVEGGGNPLYELTDSTGATEKPAFFRHAINDVDTIHTFKQGEDYKFRIVFIVPKDATAKSIILATENSRKWGYDLSTVSK